ncbi:MAG: phosphoribosylamine--glycine ligase [Coriobacteriia bacterium]|nr:phosphoribosylamine--glycine ligase [Coriobacteriia bacterium]
MNVLILGGGGREHAIAWALSRSEQDPKPKLIVAPGNAGTAKLGRNVTDLDIEDPQAVVRYAVGQCIDLVVVGPEAPLVAGVVDALEEEGIRTLGPSAAAARLEGSKSFAKDVMRRAGVPTGEWAEFTEEDAALAYLEETGAPVVVKADGLAAGKGVTVAMDLAGAREAVHECFSGRFGEAGHKVVIEEYLEGQEVSLLALTDGVFLVPLAPAQDHKRAFDGDTGPNTGGMGCYSPVPVVDEEAFAKMAQALAAVVWQMADDGNPYRGVLYGGFILTEDGPKVLEFNARLGDPESQVVLPRLRSDLLELVLATVEGRLAHAEPEWSDDVAVTVVLASGGYPGAYQTGKAIEGLHHAEEVPGVTVFHAGTRESEAASLTTAGRVLNVTALAPTFEEARERAYEAVDRIKFEGMHYRTDIGRRAIVQQHGQS